VAALRSLQVLDTPAEDRFDRITRLAQRTFGVPIALVSLVDEQRQWFKSRQGLEADETSREISFCGHAILGSEALVVEDAAEDPRFHDNPLVTGDLGLRFYAGFPLRDASGHRLGTLCLIDRRARSFSDEERRTLGELARLVESELRVVRLGASQLAPLAAGGAAHRRFLLDPGTGVWSRAGIFEVIEHARERCRVQDLDLSLVHVSLGEGQDRACEEAPQLAGLAQALRASVRPQDAVGRVGTAEFLVVLLGCDAEDTADCVGSVVLHARTSAALIRSGARASFRVMVVEPADERPVEQLLVDVEVAEDLAA
jgi:GGDEF domain-containing protein